MRAGIPERARDGIVKTNVSEFLMDAVEHLSRRKKQLIALLTDAVMLPIALWSALALRLGEISPECRRTSGRRSSPAP